MVDEKISEYFRTLAKKTWEGVSDEDRSKEMSKRRRQGIKNKAKKYGDIKKRTNV
jgi:hypothetical protein|tara:strand:- start:3191 stop:3355 length:165 start_codon:yes stop_codon:yes gene_type:complete